MLVVNLLKHFLNSLKLIEKKDSKDITLLDLFFRWILFIIFGR